MFIRNTVISLLIIICIITLVILPSNIFAQTESYMLENGMTVILKEVHTSPMISSMVFVKSGSKYESKFENGITHFLEHLLFDGTATLTREELDASIDDLGGYINAFTRKELTSYLVLLPKQYIEYGMTVQADMLFNSVFPEDEFAKERKVVIEEINRDMDSPTYPAEKFFTHNAYAETDYEKSVLGYKAFIENIPREAVIDYWKRYYIPENMTLMVIGDFDSEQIKYVINNVFGKFKSDAGAATTGSFAKIKISGGQISGQQIFDTIANVNQTFIDFSFNAPKYDDSDYFSVDLLSRYLGLDEVSPLSIALKGGAEPLVAEFSVNLVPYEEFSRLEISAITDKSENSDTIVTLILDHLKTITAHNADEKSIKGIKTTIKCDDIYYASKLHYYGFIISPYIMTAGWDFVKLYSKNMEKISWSQSQKAAWKWFSSPSFIATVVKPMDSTGTANMFIPMTISANEVTNHFDSVQIPTYELFEGKKVIYPITDSISFELADKAEYHREVYENGLTIIIKSAPGSEVFAMNVIGKGRTINEPEGKAGITDFVNRCLEKGTKNRDAKQLSSDLSLIGANVTLYDNPWIPYDDRYTSRRFSFLKFETIDEFARNGFDLFKEILLEPSFDSTEVENVRQTLLSLLGRKTTSAEYIAKNQFFNLLFPNHKFARPVMGDINSISSITVEDLKTHHFRFYSPENIIVSIVSGKPIDEIKTWVDSSLALFPKGGIEPAFYGFNGHVTYSDSSHTEMDKEQITLMIGGSLPNARSSDAVSISVAGSILSNKLYLNLRERQGLAYSVGASTNFDREIGWYYCSIGTANINYRTAIDGILLEIEKLQFDGPTSSELNRARNKIWGQLQSAKLSAINQAYYLGLNEFEGLPLDYDRRLLSTLSSITADKIRRIASQYFTTDSFILSTAGKLTE